MVFTALNVEKKFCDPQLNLSSIFFSFLPICNDNNFRFFAAALMTSTAFYDHIFVFLEINVRIV